MLAARGRRSPGYRADAASRWSLFGIYTRLTGRAVHGLARAHPAGQVSLACGVSATFPSIPAVLRPALRLRHPPHADQRVEPDRSISFCRLRTRSRSPACDAVKIRCRRRRTFSSAARQSIAPSRGARPPVRSPRQQRPPRPAPHQPPALSWCPTCPSAPASSPSSLSRAHLTASAPFRVQASACIRPVIRDGRRRGQPSRPGFLLPFGSRHSLLGHPVPARDLGLPYGRLTGHHLVTGPGRGYHVPHLRDTTGMGALSTPGTAVLSRPDAVPGQRLPLLSGQSLHPAPASHQRGSSLRGINGGSRDSPVRSAPHLWPPGWDGRSLGFPLCSAPRCYQRRTTGRGRAMSTHPELRDRHSRPSNPRVQLARCDLVSQRQMRTFSQQPGLHAYSSGPATIPAYRRWPTKAMRLAWISPASIAACSSLSLTPASVAKK